MAQPRRTSKTYAVGSPMICIAAAFLCLSKVLANQFQASEHWGQIGPWKQANFGIKPDGLPVGCAYEQIHVLQRHTERYPTGSSDDSGLMLDLASKIAQAKANGTLAATGRLEFLNDWQYSLGKSMLTAKGAAASAKLGAEFWARYGRLLYGTPDQVRYNETLFHNDEKPIFRTTNQERMSESAKWYISGFFSNVNANSSSNLYDLVIIPEGGSENNTLAPYDSCLSINSGNIASQLLEIGARDRMKFVDRYTKRAQKRIRKLLSKEFDLTTRDVFAMQKLCAYETAALWQSDFCGLFKEQDWYDFDYALGLEMYSGYGYGSPAGRAQGLGYLQELLARLEHRRITTSNSAINTTLDSTEATFGHATQSMFFDATHDTVLVSVMTAMGLSFFNYTKGAMPASIKKAPRMPSFKLSDLTPFGAKLHTEVISCSKDTSMTFTKNQLKFGQYTPYTQPSAQPDKVEYVRMKLNEGVLPVAKELGCNNAGSEYGFCTLSEFLRVLQHAERDAQYEEVCFGDRVLKVNKQVANGNLDFVNV